MLFNTMALAVHQVSSFSLQLDNADIRADSESLKQAHVVVTSYSVLSSEHGSYLNGQVDKAHKKSKAKKASSSDEDTDDSSNFGRALARKKKATAKPKKILDALFHVKWWRIVLDEAHNIKNRKTKAALACCDLEGKFRWCLTGTPM